jgi:hypothetical protein
MPDTADEAGIRAYYDVIGKIIAGYTHPVGSAIITVALMSIAFLAGVLDGLGSAFIPLVHKADVLGTFFSYLAVILFFGGLLRLLILIIVNLYRMWRNKRRALKSSGIYQKLDWEKRYVGPISSAVASVLFAISLFIFALLIMRAYDFVLAICVLLSALLTVLFIYFYPRLWPVVLFSLQVAFLILMFATGRLWIEVQRVKPANTHVHLRGGTIVDGSVAFSSESGVIVFTGGAVEPEYYPWERVEKISVIATGRQAEPSESADFVRAVVRIACRIKGSTDADCIQ